MALVTEVFSEAMCLPFNHVEVMRLRFDHSEAMCLWFDHVEDVSLRFHHADSCPLWFDLSLRLDLADFSSAV
jgi:hypothetical protein